MSFHVYFTHLEHPCVSRMLSCWLLSEFWAGPKWTSDLVPSRLNSLLQEFDNACRTRIWIWPPKSFEKKTWYLQTHSYWGILMAGSATIHGISKIVECLQLPEAVTSQLWQLHLFLRQHEFSNFHQSGFQFDPDIIQYNLQVWWNNPEQCWSKSRTGKVKYTTSKVYLFCMHIHHQIFMYHNVICLYIYI